MSTRLISIERLVGIVIIIIVPLIGRLIVAPVVSVAELVRSIVVRGTFVRSA